MISWIRCILGKRGDQATQKTSEKMFLVKRIWIDPLENRVAYGFHVIGFVTNENEAKRIKESEYIQKSLYPWPLKYANEFEGDHVPEFTAEEIPNLEGLSLDELKKKSGL